MKCCQLGGYSQGITVWKLKPCASAVSLYAGQVLGLGVTESQNGLSRKGP